MAILLGFLIGLALVILVELIATRTVAKLVRELEHVHLQVIDDTTTSDPD